MRTILILLAALTIAASCTGPGANEKEARPNIVFVFSDDHATQAISAYGGIFAELAPTPSLDELANEGMLFDRCMVTNSICGPSRATILTGKHSHINGFYQNENTVFDGTQFTYPQALQSAGYQTAIIGKWHLGGQPTGFDYWEILPGQGHYYNPEFITTEGKHTEKGYVSDLVTEKALSWLEGRDQEKPFMVMIQHKAPHRNWMPAERHLSAFDEVTMPEPATLFDDYEGRGTAAREQDMTIDVTMDMGRDLKVVELEYGTRISALLNRLDPEQRAAWDEAYQPKNDALLAADLSGEELVKWKYQRYVKDYLRCIKAVDESVGTIKAWLEENGLDENTVFVYSSDQGFYLGEHGWFDKRFMYDESYRTPLIVKWPGVTESGSRSSELVSNLDFASTFLEMAGLDVPEEVQGESLVPILAGDAPEDWRGSLYYHYYEWPGWHMVHRHEGAYDGRYKLMNYYDLDEWELYDLETDPMEMQNQFANPEYAEVVEMMKAELQRLRLQYQVPENVPQDTANPETRYHSLTMRKKLQEQE